MNEQPIERPVPPAYAIRVRGVLGDQLAASAFPDLTALPEGGDTWLVGHLPDQSALHGVLGRVEALGLELVEVRRR